MNWIRQTNWQPRLNNNFDTFRWEQKHSESTGCLIGSESFIFDGGLVVVSGLQFELLSVLLKIFVSASP